uniref:CWF19 like cell cycle control factor 2 n=1 Tax=Leptobrachium leishanense TaxID=445787 RepID=A0A8C5Q0S0_9ANUR
MMAAYDGSFESARSIEEKKESRRKAREQVLSQAKEDHEKAERRKEQRHLRGEDTWMLNDVNERLEELNQEQSSKNKKDKHQKKKKKEKKKKHKKQKAERGESSGDSSQDSEEEEWVESSSCQPDGAEKAWKIKKEDAARESDPVVSRDEWMTLDFMSLKATSTAALRAEKQKGKTLEHEKAEAIEKEKLQARELNPFWKDGRQGLPPEEGDISSIKKAANIEDGGLSWLRKSYQRMKEQAERGKRNLEDVVAERYGSMEAFQDKLDAAERAAMQNSAKEYDGRRDRWRKYPETESRKFVRPDNYKDQDHHSTSQRHERSSHGDHSRDRAKWERRESDRNRADLEHGRFPDRPGSDAKRDSSSSVKQKFLKPSEDHERPTYKTMATPTSSSKSAFLKPAAEERSTSWRKSASKGHNEEKCQPEMEDRRDQESQEPDEKNDRNAKTEDSVTRDEKPPSSPDPKPPLRILSEEEMNKLGAKVVKAELLGNTELASKLRAQLEDARLQSKNQPQASRSAAGIKSNTEESDMKEDAVLLVRTDQSGRSWPVSALTNPMEAKGGRRKRQMITTHVDKERVRYFHDDDNQSLQDLVKREKMGTAEDQNKLYMRMASKFMGKTDQDYYTLDDMFVSKAANKESENTEEERERQQAIAEHRRLAARMEKCPFCFDNAELPKHLIVAIGVKMFRKAVVKMFQAQDLDCVFLEANINMKRRLHLVYECIPLPREVGDMAPLYFKKAIMECDEEWAMNKKLIDLSTKDIRRSVPKGLPYFSVDFGLQGGFAHVIENEHKFPHYFGKEIIGGMLDLEPRVWRKAVRENFDDQRKKVLQFAQWWKPFDITKDQ